MCCKPEPKFIRKSFSKDKVYSVYLNQIKFLEQTITKLSETNEDLAFEAAMDIGVKLFPIIDSISLNILSKRNGREYFKELGYSGIEADMIYSMFRNGMMHALNPYEFKFKDCVVSWGLMSSSGSGGFLPYYSGYSDGANPEYNIPADKAFIFDKLSDSKFHASLSLDVLAAQVRFDLEKRMKEDTREKIDVVVGQQIDNNIHFTDKG